MVALWFCLGVDGCSVVYIILLLVEFITKYLTTTAD